MKKHVGLLILVSLIIVSGLAVADTTRSCKAQYIVSVRYPEGGTDGIGYPFFSGQGTMDYYAPNSARKKAYSNLCECSDAFDDREREVVYCSEANQIYGYPFDNGLIQQIRSDFCGNRTDNIIIDLHLILQGDEGCVPGRNEWDQIIVRDYPIFCGVWASDARLKSNITPIDIGLHEILELYPVTFNWKNDSNESLHYGLIAQEVEKVIPNAVIRSDIVTNDTPDGQMFLKYEEIIPILIKSIQELNKKVELIENKLNSTDMDM